MSKKTHSTGLKLNLDEFNKASHNFLIERDEEEKNLNIKKTKKKTTSKDHKDLQEKPEEKEDKKLGRPMIEGELLNKKLIASVTEEEYENVIKKAGLVSVSTYLRTQMREAGII